MAQVTAREEVVIPVGEYGVEIINIDYDEEGEYGAQYRWRFKLSAPAKAVKEFGEKHFVAWTSESDFLKSKFMEWCAAAYNRPIAAGEVVDTDLCVGRRVIAAIIKKKNKKTGDVFNKVDSISAYAKNEPMGFETDAGDSDSFKVGEPEADPFEDE